MATYNVKFLFRFTAVCRPFQYREKNNSSNVIKSVLKVILPIIIFSITLNIPRFFETTVVYLQENFTENNSTIFNEIITYDVTPLRMNPDYVR